MSRGAKPVVTALFGLAALVAAGSASAACPGHGQTAQTPNSDSVASTDQKAPKAPVDRRG